MTIQPNATSFDISGLIKAADLAARAIPPAWPLAATVAVNPYLGQADQSLAEAGARLSRVAGLSVTMPRAWYAIKIAQGTISDIDLGEALAAASQGSRPTDVAALKVALRHQPDNGQALPTVADLAAKASGIDWPGVIADRISTFAASHFDEGQALWITPSGRGTYTSWRDFASHDLTPEIVGLSGFPAHVANAPETATGALARSVESLGLHGDALDTYFHQMLMTLGGWAQYARYKLWQAELASSVDSTITDLLAIRLIWEEALFGLYSDKISKDWTAAGAAHAVPLSASADQVIDEILQDAAERGAQRGLAIMFSAPAMDTKAVRPPMQAAFCIDVRSEVFRRALEAAHPTVQTLGFAGFFGLTTGHRRFASDVTEMRLPVLLSAGVFTCSGGPEDAAADQSARFSARAKRAFGRFKLAAVSSFAFVEATGPVYGAKLVRDSLGIVSAPAPHDPPPRLNPALDLAARTTAAVSILRAMSLTSNFARLVVMAGHGASVVNNPHASALHCGACGGYSGEVNARLLALLLNDPEIRSGLDQNGISIPADTLFLAALHDTTTDAVTLYETDHIAPDHAPDIAAARAMFAAAGILSRQERALRLPRAETGHDVSARSRDWAEVRPEWALAGCKAFIAAPRSRTQGKDLAGRAFLHDYDWRQDKSFGVLELIMTAPVVVASWISLQYYGSTVSPQFFGAGNKLLHNVTGGIGVLEGNGGLLRVGLPWQSVHDGETLAHEPLRLSVCIEAPVEAMSDILRRHDGVRALFDNRWLHLFALDENGQMTQRYAGNLKWETQMQPSNG
jgi:uncharacterized protein